MTLIGLIENWLRGDAPYMSRAMEPINISLRIREWIWALMLVGKDPEFPDHMISVMRHSLLQQASRLSRHIEYETPGNHPMVNLLAIWLVSVMYDYRVRGRSAKAWADMFEKEAARSFLPDGFHVELSTHYHLQSCRLLEEYMWLTRAVGNVPSRTFAEKVECWRRTVGILTPPGGSFPILGDQCYSFSEDGIGEDLCFLRALYPVSEDLVSIGDCLRSPSAYWLKALSGATLSAESPLLARSTQKDIGKGQVTETHWFQAAGYLVCRCLDPAIQGLFMLDAGDLGFYRNPGHGHADQLSVLLYLRGQPILVDPGVLRYGDHPDYLWFKKACAHNTLSFAGHESADLWRYFRWSSLPSRPQLRHSLKDDILEASAVFNGYNRTLGAIHSRTILLDWRRALTIKDVVDYCPDGPSPELSFHFHPRSKIRRVGNARYVLEIGGNILSIDFTASVGGMAFVLTEEPVASEYGRCSRGPVIRLHPEQSFPTWSIEVRIGWNSVSTYPCPAS